MKTSFTFLVMGGLLMLLGSCGKSADEQARQQNAQQQALQKALADSLAEEREKDRRMREAAATQADERIARDAEQSESDAAAARQINAASQAISDAMRRYTDRLRQYTGDNVGLQFRNAVISPSGNAMCAEFAAKDKSGVMSGFKRVIVTENSVAPELPPAKDTLMQFLLFQLAARDTGCFPDVQNVHILQ
jgi:hypothetical protein